MYSWEAREKGIEQPIANSKKEMLRDPKLLKEYFNQGKDRIEEIDENGQTLLHHAAIIGVITYPAQAREIFSIIPYDTGNFSIQDKNGHTPVHVAALYCHDKVNCEVVFPNIVLRAEESGFNFSTLNTKGLSVLHIATKTTYINPYSGDRINNVEKLLKLVPKIGLNILSSSELTPFAYAIQKFCLSEAFTLLRAGADPFVYGEPGCAPLNIINRYLEKIQNILSREEELYEDEIKGLNIAILKLKGLKDQIAVIKFNNEQQSGDKFGFWGKSKEQEQWTKINTRPSEKNPHLYRAGPGYGF